MALNIFHTKNHTAHLYHSRRKKRKTKYTNASLKLLPSAELDTLSNQRHILLEHQIATIYLVPVVRLGLGSLV